MPDVPTLLETGVDCYVPRYYYIGFPKGTPHVAIDKFEAAVEKVSQMPEYIDMENLDVTPSYMEVATTAQHIKDSTEVLKKNNDYFTEYQEKYGSLLG